MPDDFQTLVLCGGKGERLQPLTLEKQKCIIEIQGLPFLEYLNYQLNDFGIFNIVFCSGYKSEQIMKLFGTSRGDSHYYKYSNPSYFISTGARILSARPFYKDVDNLIIFNGDSYCNIDRETFWKLYRNFIKSKYKICKLLIHKDGSLLSSFIGQKYETNYFGAGIYFIKKDLLEDIEYSDKLSLENDIINKNFDKTLFVKLPNNFFVIDYGTHENYRIVNDKETKFGRFFANINSWINDKTSEVFP